MIDLNKARLGALAGLLAGLVIGGVGARIAMRFVALSGGLPVEFTAGGTLAILFLGAFLGLIFGLLFMAVRQIVPLSALWQGLLYGFVLLLIFVVPPFFLLPEGEFTLISPLAGLLIFGPIPLLYGMVLAKSITWTERRYPPAERRRVGLLWFTWFGLALLLSIINLANLLGANRLFYPPEIFRLLQILDIPARATEPYRTLLVLLFMVAYWASTAYIFWRSVAVWQAKFTAVTLLTFAAVFFQAGSLFSNMMNSLSLVRLAPGLLQAFALGSLLALFFIFPNGHFMPGWTRPLWFVWLGWLLLWLLTPFVELWPEIIPIIVLIAALGSGTLAQVWRYRRQDKLQIRQQTKGVVVAIVVTVFTFCLLLLLTVIVPDLKARGLPGLDALFAFSLYWLPWLLIPAAIVYAIRHRGLWQAG